MGTLTVVITLCWVTAMEEISALFHSVFCSSSPSLWHCSILNYTTFMVSLVLIVTGFPYTFSYMFPYNVPLIDFYHSSWWLITLYHLYTTLYSWETIHLTVQDKDYTHNTLSVEYTSSCLSQSKLVKRNSEVFKLLPLWIPAVVTVH